MDHELRERRLEANWRLLHTTSMIAAVVTILLLLAIDAFYQFASPQLNIVIVLVALCFFVLWKLEAKVHELSRSMRERMLERMSLRRELWKKWRTRRSQTD